MLIVSSFGFNRIVVSFVISICRKLNSNYFCEPKFIFSEPLRIDPFLTIAGEGNVFTHVPLFTGGSLLLSMGGSAY